MSKKTTTIAFDEAADAELTRLADELQTTKAGVIRNALSLYSFLKDELAVDDRALAVMEGATMHSRIAVPGLQNRTRRNRAVNESGLQRPAEGRG